MEVPAGAGTIAGLNQSSDAIYQQAPAMSLKANNLKYFLIRQLLEKKEFDEIALIKRRLQMQAIGKRHQNTVGSQLDEEAIWKEYAEDQERQKTQYDVSSANLSPYGASQNEFRKAIFGR